MENSEKSRRRSGDEIHKDSHCGILSGNGATIVTHILFVDDDVDFLRMMEIQLKAHGYEVTVAESQKEAEEKLALKRPDVAVIDLMMENEDAGFSLAYRIKKDDPSTPVIMVTNVTAETGMIFEADTKEARSWVKADVILSKPVRFEQLKAEMDKLLGRKANGDVKSSGR